MNAASPRRAAKRRPGQRGSVTMRNCSHVILICAITATVLPSLCMGAETGSSDVLFESAGPLGPSTAGLLRIETTAANHPSDDEVILYRGVIVRMSPDGRIERRVRQVERLLTDHAITLRGDLRVAHVTTHQDLVVHTCRTFMLDGREVPALPRAFNRTTPDRVASCPDRTDLQETVISFLGVERGCLVELDYTIRDRDSWRPWLEGIEPLGATAPIHEEEIIVELPSGSALNAVMIADGAVAPARLTDGSPAGNQGAAGQAKVLHQYDLAAYPDEGGSPDLQRIPQLLYTTCESWKTLLSWVDQRIQAAAVPDPAIETWAEGDLISGRPPLDDAERARRVAWLLGERTAPADDPQRDWWLPVRSAARTFDSSCGNLLDRAALAMAALRASGIAARPVLRPSLPAIVHGVPSLAQFDNLWIAVGPHLLDVRDGSFGPLADPGQAEEVLDRTGSDPAFVKLAPRRGTSFLSLHLRQGDDGGAVTGEAIARVGGSLCRPLDLQDLKGYLEGLVGQYAQGAALAGYRVEALAPDTLAVTFSLTGTALGESLGNGRRGFAIPSAPGFPEGARPEGLSLTRPSRLTPIFLPCLAREEVRIQLDLASDTVPLILPSKQRAEGGGVLFEQSAEREGATVRLTRLFQTSQRTIRREEYPGFRTAMLDRTRPSGNVLYLAKRQEGN